MRETSNSEYGKTFHFLLWNYFINYKVKGSYTQNMFMHIAYVWCSVFSGFVTRSFHWIQNNDEFGPIFDFYSYLQTWSICKKVSQCSDEAIDMILTSWNNKPLPQPHHIPFKSLQFAIHIILIELTRFTQLQRNKLYATWVGTEKFIPI